MANVTPIRSRPTVIEPGQSIADAEWHAGWNACRADLLKQTNHAYARGRSDGLSAGMTIGPTWQNLIVVSTLALVIGLLVGAAWL